MSIFNIFSISGAGLSVQRQRMDVITENIANLNTTKTPEGGPYKPKAISIGSTPLKNSPFDFESVGIKLPKVKSVAESNKPPIQVYDPTHPDATAEGYVSYPDISATEELVNMMTATTAYEANMNIFNSSKTMMMRTLEMGEA